MHHCNLECGWEYGDPVPECVGRRQRCVDDAYWTILSGMHDIDQGHPDITYEMIALEALRVLSKCQMGVG